MTTTYADLVAAERRRWVIDMWRSRGVTLYRVVLSDRSQGDFPVLSWEALLEVLRNARTNGLLHLVDHVERAD